MRLAIRALAGAAASIALGALFTGTAIGAEPTTAEADANATLTLGLGSDADTEATAEVGGILNLADGAASSGLAVDSGAAVATGGGQLDGAMTSADADLTAGIVAGAGSDAGGGDATAASSSRIELNATQSSLAGAGRDAGTVLIIDLDASRDDAVGASAELASDLQLAAGDAAGSSADGAAALGVLFGTNGSATEADAVAGTAVGVAPAAPAPAAPPATDVAAVGDGTGEPTTSATVERLSNDAGVLGSRALGPVIGAVSTTPVEVVGGDAPAGGDGEAAPAGSTTSTGPTLPDTAFGGGGGLALWGLLLVTLAGLVSARRRLAAGPGSVS